MLPMRIVRPAFLLLGGLATAGCGVASVGTMVPLPPAPDWNTTLESDRKNRDDFFRESLETPLLAEASAAGASTLGGRPMLVYQGAAAFELWTGVQAPVDVMFDAARRAL